MTTVQRLKEALVAVCPLQAIRLRRQGEGDFEPAPEANPAQRAAAAAVLASFDYSDAAHEAWVRQRHRRPAAEAAFDPGGDEAAVVIKAIVTLVHQTFVAHAATWNDYKAAVSAASNLADLKVRVAAIPALSTPTREQVIAAIRQTIRDGAAD